MLRPACHGRFGSLISCSWFLITTLRSSISRSRRSDHRSMCSGRFGDRFTRSLASYKGIVFSSHDTRGSMFDFIKRKWRSASWFFKYDAFFLFFFLFALLFYLLFRRFDFFFESKSRKKSASSAHKFISFEYRWFSRRFRRSYSIFWCYFRGFFDGFGRRCRLFGSRFRRSFARGFWHIQKNNIKWDADDSTHVYLNIKEKRTSLSQKR